MTRLTFVNPWIVGIYRSQRRWHSIWSWSRNWSRNLSWSRCWNWSRNLSWSRCWNWSRNLSWSQCWNWSRHNCKQIQHNLWTTNARQKSFWVALIQSALYALHESISYRSRKLYSTFTLPNVSAACMDDRQRRLQPAHVLHSELWALG